MRADRLIRILQLLQQQGRTTARELAALLEVSERTVHRDMEALSASGMPVYAERGANGGWRLQEGYRSLMTGLTVSEIRAILLLQSSSVVQDLNLSADTANALRKLSSGLPPAARDEAAYTRRHLHIDGAGWQDSLAPTPLLGVVQQAVWAHRWLAIRYPSADGQAAEVRLVAPWGLIAKRHTWYFAAVTGTMLAGGVAPVSLNSDDALAAPRTFRVSRLISAELLEDRFEIPASFDLADWWVQSTAQFKAALPVYPGRILVRNEVLERFRRESYAQIKATQSADSGWVAVEVHFHTEDSARGLLLGYGAAVKVLAPDKLMLSLTGEAKALLALYTGPDSAPQDHGQMKV